jgi:hypothetical protein
MDPIMTRANKANRAILGGIFVISLLPVLVGCDTADDRAVRVIQHDTDSLWNLTSAESLQTLVSSHPHVFVGEVLAVEYKVARDGVPVTLEPLPAYTPVGKPILTGVNDSYVQSFYTIRVTEPISGSLAAGNTVRLYQPGGEATANDGSITRTVYDGDLAFEKGQSYLIFAANHSGFEGTLSSPPWGKFVVEGSNLTALSEGWERLPVVTEIVQKGLDGLTESVAGIDESREH